MSRAQTEVRSALAAYIHGETPLPLFEQSVARLLQGRDSARSVVQSELTAAVAEGTLPPESLSRLGLQDSTTSNWSDTRRSSAPIPECGALIGGRYRLERVLGEGGMGVVFSAVDQEIQGERFAVKVLRPQVRESRESMRLLREEVRRTRALRHPNIVGVYSLNSDPSGVYMLMEHLEGRSLKHLIEEEFNRGMPLIRAWSMICDIGAALAYAHDHNVVHSDIKPSNIVITSSGSCKLLDFGIARAERSVAGAGTQTDFGALTPAYACCEMFEGRPSDQSDDVYAFACVIYEALTGRHPFGRINAMDARARRLIPQPLEALTKRQNNALARALEFDRAHRTASVEELLTGLKGMADERDAHNPWIVWAAALAAVVAVATGWYLEHRAAHVKASTAVIAAGNGGAPAAPALTAASSVEVNAAALATAPIADPATPHVPVRPTSATLVSPILAVDSAPAAPSSVAQKAIDHPPFGNRVAAVIATAASRADMQSEDNCPYPAEARSELQTGTVVLLMYISPNGRVANAVLNGRGSSGSPILDQAAVKCVRELGRFPTRLVDGKPVGYWARTKFLWSFG